MLYILIAAAIMEACTFAYARIEHGGKISAQADAKAARLELSDYQTKQRDYIAKLVVEGAQAAAAQELKAKELDNERKAAVTRYADLARRLAARSDPVSPAVIGLLDNAISASAGKDAAIAAPKSSADSPSVTSNTGDWLDWSLEAINLYAACRDQIAGFQSFYNKLRDAQQ